MTSTLSCCTTTLNAAIRVTDFAGTPPAQALRDALSVDVFPTLDFQTIDSTQQEAAAELQTSTKPSEPSQPLCRGNTVLVQLHASAGRLSYNSTFTFVVKVKNDP